MRTFAHAALFSAQGSACAEQMGLSAGMIRSLLRSGVVYDLSHIRAPRSRRRSGGGRLGGEHRAAALDGARVRV
eukprot:4815215-Pleurochrysis_carterae.AAC.1